MLGICGASLRLAVPVEAGIRPVFSICEPLGNAGDPVFAAPLVPSRNRERILTLL
jgi:hypothetical protein